ncbi:MAG: endonuclease/exonuclease/phosphatase family protein [Anaerolineae bacterium]|nr:endonuclease/exonuclease/phosphatase family protein [Anaerolineae bacterium]MDQ7033761.1 endonuclease/exonuclease/phosphatase family protein [Anaerolineae bacterium]
MSEVRVVTSLNVKTEAGRPSLLRRIPKIVFLLIVFVYGMTTAIFIGLWLALGETNYAVNIFVNTMPIALLPAPILLLIALLSRQWKSLLMLVAALAMLIGLYGGTLRPPGPNLLIRGQEVTLLTYNVQRRNTDFEGIEQILRSQDADIVALQEVTLEMRNYFDENLSDLYPFQVAAANAQTEHTQMILSKWSIDVQGRRPVMRGVIEIDDTGVELVVYSVQLSNPLTNDGEGFDDSTRSQQGNIVRLMAADEDGAPLIILGDFNMSDATNEYREFTKDFIDVFRHTERGFGATFPNWDYINPSLNFLPPLIRLDYAFLSLNINPADARVIPEGSSDHYPIWIKIRVQ